MSRRQRAPTGRHDETPPSAPGLVARLRLFCAALAPLVAISAVAEAAARPVPVAPEQLRADRTPLTRLSGGKLMAVSRIQPLDTEDRAAVELKRTHRLSKTRPKIRRELPPVGALGSEMSDGFETLCTGHQRRVLQSPGCRQARRPARVLRRIRAAAPGTADALPDTADDRPGRIRITLFRPGDRRAPARAGDRALRDIRYRRAAAYRQQPALKWGERCSTRS